MGGQTDRGVPKSRGRSSRRWTEIIRPACRTRDQRANAPCWICGQAIDYTIPSGQPDSWSPDHVYTVDRHPELAEDPANIRASHLACNKSRNNAATATTLLGNQSRTW